MDYMLDIIIPRAELENIRMREVLREWGGTAYSSSPKLFVSDSNIEFVEITELAYYDRILHFLVNEDLIVLHLKSHILYDLELFANKERQDGENALLIFLKGLFRLSNFYILLIREDELIKKKFEISNEEELEIALLSSIKWDSPTDVLLYK